MIETIFKFVGRPPKWQVTHNYMIQAIKDFFGSNPYIGSIISKIKTSRSEKGCAYTNDELIWTAILSNMMRYPSKHQFDQNRNEPVFSETIFNLAGRPYRKDYSENHTACSQTIINLMKKIDEEELQKAQIELVRHLFRSKFFKFAQLLGFYCIAVDATVKDRKFNRKDDPVDPKHRNRYVLEAKLITPWGWAISIVSEPIEPYSSDKEKQDSEYKGFIRLSEKLHKAFPHCPICIIGDALYHCQPVRELCAKYNWQYIFTAKEGRAPELYKSFKAEIEANPKQSAKIADKYGELVTSLRWACGANASFDVDYDVTCDFVEIIEEDGKGKATGYTGAFATSFEIKNEKDARRIAIWGRRRWNIENSFKVMKHDGYGLEHTFCLDERVSNNLYALMTIAHTLWQLFYSGIEARLSKKTRKVTQRDLAEKLKIALLTIGITEPLVDRGARFSRAYMDEARLDAA